jgi:uncharacterized cupredoxin-like copper-binding protein
VKRALTRALTGTVAGIAAVALSACTTQRPATTGSVVRISEGDFHISAPRRVAAGDLVLRVHNRGPDAHELLVIKTENGQLPLRGDGLTVDEDAVQRNEVGVLEPGAPGSVRELDVHLTPGRYVLLCNMSGHYLGGMRRTLVVR